MAVTFRIVLVYTVLNDLLDRQVHTVVDLFTTAAVAFIQLISGSADFHIFDMVVRY
jgi:hypothetical protein